MAISPDTDFEKNVFINCPFDDDYIRLLQPLLFTILYLEFNPRIATERSDSGEQRIDKICELIELSKYSIHDLSRLQSKKKKEFYRLNMPFELGIDYGCRNFATNHHKGKKFLVLEKGRYDYAKALSDLSGVDIKNHNDDPIKIIRIARNWLAGFVTGKPTDAPAIVWEKFNLFMQNFAEERTEQGFSKDDIYEMPVSEFIGYIKDWLLKNNNPIAPGLGSTAIIKGGEYNYTSSNLSDEIIKEFNFTVKSGKIARNENGKLVGHIIIRSPVVSAQRFIESIGKDRQDFVSEESYISIDSSKPTTFTSLWNITYPHRTPILNPTEQDVEYRTKTISKGHLQNLTFKGTFDAFWETDFPNGNFKAAGVFEIYLS